MGSRGCWRRSVAWRGVSCLACWTPLSGAPDTQDKSCTRHGVACQALWHGAQAGGHAQVAPGPPSRSDRQQRKQSTHRTTLSASATSSRGMRCRRSSKYLRLTCSRPGEKQWLGEELYQEQRDNKSIDTENARSSIGAAGAAAGCCCKRWATQRWYSAQRWAKARCVCPFPTRHSRAPWEHHPASASASTYPLLV